MLIMGVTTSGAQTLAPREYQIKAAFLYNFTKFSFHQAQADADHYADE